jgi:hypothetical protein
VPAGNLLGVINRTIVPSLVDYDPCAISRVPITPSRLTEKKEVMRTGRHRKRDFIEMRGDGLAVEVVIDSRPGIPYQLSDNRYYQVVRQILMVTFRRHALFLVQTSLDNPASYRGEARDLFGGA